MRFIVFLALLSSAVLISGCPARAVDSETGIVPGSDQTSSDGPRQPVLVELFTSEGCSSCPPADKNLAFLDSQQPVPQAEIITLAFHVDYWDRLGWKDRFSSPLFSRRQEIYSQALKLDSSYTPQMIVDGESQFVGSDSGKAAKEIAKAAGSAKAVVDITSEGDQVKVKVARAQKHGEATVYAAIAEDGVSTRVERGENSGKTLEHVSVVRELKALGIMPAEKHELETSFALEANAEWNAEKLKVVVFVQENESRRIVGVGRLVLSKAAVTRHVRMRTGN
jgi:hypothetical protein